MFTFSPALQQRPVGMTGGIRAATQPLLDEHDGISSKQLKVATARSMLQSRVRAA